MLFHGILDEDCKDNVEKCSKAKIDKSQPTTKNRYWTNSDFERDQRVLELRIRISALCLLIVTDSHFVRQ